MCLELHQRLMMKEKATGHVSLGVEILSLIESQLVMGEKIRTCRSRALRGTAFNCKLTFHKHRRRSEQNRST